MNIDIGYNTADALDFLHGYGQDGNGRTFADYILFDSDKWEECHNHVQWAFPSHIKSRFNENAPVVDMAELADELTVTGISNAMTLVDAYLESLGFAFGADKQWHFDASNPRTQLWLIPYNHNYQRISRLLNFLHWINPDMAIHLLGEFLEAANAAINFGNKYNLQHIISAETVVYWSKAAIGRL